MIGTARQLLRADCPACRGTGVVFVACRSPRGAHEVFETWCPRCPIQIEMPMPPVVLVERDEARDPVRYVTSCDVYVVTRDVAGDRIARCFLSGEEVRHYRGAVADEPHESVARRMAKYQLDEMVRDATNTTA